jgi:hypothetical protein
MGVQFIRRRVQDTALTMPKNNFSQKRRMRGMLDRRQHQRRCGAERAIMFIEILAMR